MAPEECTQTSLGLLSSCPPKCGQHLAPSVWPLADQRRCLVLANDQIKFGVIGHAVAFVRGTLDLGDAAPRIPAPPHVAWHVREQQIMIDRMPDRSLRKVKTGADLRDRRIRIDQGLEFGA